MDPSNSIEEYKAEWTRKVKDDSTNLFNLAKAAVEMKPDMEVIIVKRLPRYDLKSQDPIHIKQSLSELSNSVYDQLWLENGGPTNIHIVSLDKMECYGYLKDIIYGASNSPNYDGIHLRGAAASRHFTYRAVNAVKHVLWLKKTSLRYPANLPQFQHNLPGSRNSNYQPWKHNNGGSSNYSANHDNCPQTKYQWRTQSRVGSRSGQSGNRAGKGYAHNSEDNQQIGSCFYSIPVQNRFPENF